MTINRKSVSFPWVLLLLLLLNEKLFPVTEFEFVYGQVYYVITCRGGGGSENANF